MGNCLSIEPGSSVEIVKNPIGQIDDSRRGGEETEERGWNQTAVKNYSCFTAKYQTKFDSIEKWRIIDF